MPKPTASSNTICCYKMQKRLKIAALFVVLQEKKVLQER